jgi:pyruvate/2-oxoglutarate dehydrogenase complex dihydrolipoamide acyltransferase (E2) component
MARTVIMPMLGMAQETGVIVSWLKAHGDAVRAGEPLMEVETDKAVMEVEATDDGYLADIRFGDGDTVPVGEVVAMILPEPPGGAPAAAAAPASAPIASAAPAQIPPAAPAPASAPVPVMALAPLPSGRILASPKARRLAAEQGLDLGRLASAGHPQPYRVADLAQLAALPAAAAGLAVNRLTASAPSDNLTAFRDLLKAQTGGLADAALWSAFAAGALRATAGEASVVIRTEALPGDPAAVYIDPDLSPLASIAPAATEATPSLILRDLTASPLGELALASDTVPVLCIAGGYRLSLTWPEGTLSTAAAIALIIGVARRIEQPLRHLL